MMLWIIFATLTAGAVVFTLTPLIRPSAKPQGATVRDVYKSQLREIEAQAASGLISTAEAEAARTEIGRRLLLASDAPLESTTAERGVISRRTLRLIAFCLAGAITLTSLGLYLWLGSPETPGRPYADRADEIKAADAEQDARVRGAAALAQVKAEAEQRVATDPNDILGRQILARISFSEGRITEALQLYDDALAVVDRTDEKTLSKEDKAKFIAEAVAMHIFADRKTTPASSALIDRALTLSPKDSLARHLRADAKREAGDFGGAIADWEALERDLKPDEPIRPIVEQRLAQAKAAIAKPN